MADLNVGRDGPRGVLIVIVKKVLGHDVGEVAARQLIDHPRNLGHGGVFYPVAHHGDELGDPAFGRSTAQRVRRSAVLPSTVPDIQSLKTNLGGRA